MVDLETLVDGEELDFLQVAIMKHVTYTGSRYAERLLGDWSQLQRRIVKVMPREYKRALAEQAKQQLRRSTATSVVTTSWQSLQRGRSRAKVVSRGHARRADPIAWVSRPGSSKFSARSIRRVRSRSASHDWREVYLP